MARTAFARKNGASTGLAELKQTPAAAATSHAASEPRGVQTNLEQVRIKAYELYQARAKAGRAGDCHSDWLEAERQVRLALPRSAQ